jgi:hypothetical protein
MARRLGLITLLVAALLAGPALAASIKGTPGPDELAGTRGDDTIRGRGGDDALSGRRGDDVLVGGAGADSLAGGRGEDRCLTDAADAAPVGCEVVQGPAGPLTIDSATGTDRCVILRRADLCFFLLKGSGADATTGTITATGGVRLTTKPDAVSARHGRWTAHGTYACDTDGTLAVTIGAETVSAPVDCLA